MMRCEMCHWQFLFSPSCVGYIIFYVELSSLNKTSKIIYYEITLLPSSSFYFSRIVLFR